jgi:hypothetical protein
MTETSSHRIVGKQQDGTSARSGPGSYPARAREKVRIALASLHESLGGRRREVLGRVDNR